MLLPLSRNGPESAKDPLSGISLLAYNSYDRWIVTHTEAALVG
jgi:hypothetical protein